MTTPFSTADEQDTADDRPEADHPKADRHDVAVIGAGPAGLSAAMVLGRQQRRVALVDSGRARNAPAREMHMVLSRDGFPPSEYRALATAELDAYDHIDKISGTVTTITGSVGEFVLRLDDDREIQASRILLATGMTDHLIDLPGLAERWGRGVYHCAYCHGFESRGRTIGVVALRAADAVFARYLADRFSDDVALYRLDGVEIDAKMLTLAQAGGVRIVDGHVTGIEGEEPTLRLLMADGTTHEREVIFHRPDARQSSPLGADLGCDIDPDWDSILVDAQHRTGVDGVYAAGDATQLRDLPNPVGFVATSAGQGQTAAIWIETELFTQNLG